MLSLNSKLDRLSGYIAGQHAPTWYRTMPGAALSAGLPPVVAYSMLSISARFGSGFAK